MDGLHLIVSYSWDFQNGSTQELTFMVGRFNLFTTCSGGKEISLSRCKKRTCEALTVICLLALETFFPRI